MEYWAGETIMDLTDGFDVFIWLFYVAIIFIPVVVLVMVVYRRRSILRMHNDLRALFIRMRSTYKSWVGHFMKSDDQNI